MGGSASVLTPFRLGDATGSCSMMLLWKALLLWETFLLLRPNMDSRLKLVFCFGLGCAIGCLYLDSLQRVLLIRLRRLRWLPSEVSYLIRRRRVSRLIPSSQSRRWEEERLTAPSSPRRKIMPIKANQNRDVEPRCGAVR